MQCDFSQSASIKFTDWADWLSSIAQRPHEHNVLTEIKGQIHYLSVNERQRMQTAGFSVKVMPTMKVIEITQKIWRNPSVDIDHKKRMLQGIQYIHEQRQAKYENLFWIVKWFANLRGIGSQLTAEREAIEQIRKELLLSQAVPVLGKKFIQPKEKVEQQLESLCIRFKKLFEEKNNRFTKGKIDWYEDFFNYEKKLYELRQTFSESQWLLVKPKFKELEKQLDEWNGEMPRVKALIKAFGIQMVKPTLQATVTTLCVDKGVTLEEGQRDQVLFQCSEFEIYALYSKRMIKAERTQVTFSLVSAIERTWKEFMDAGRKDATTRLFEGYRVIFDPLGQEAYLKENYIGKGTYKAAFVSTPFRSLKKEKDRGKFVILQPISAVEDEIEEALLSKEPMQGSFDDSQLTSGKGLDDSKSNSEDSKLDSEKTSHSENSSINEEEENYRIEAANCLKYGKLPGIWSTCNVIIVDGQVAIIQPTAGYPLITASGSEKIAPTLADMGIFYRDRELLVKDQLAYIQMMGHLFIGVKSLHELDVIHRDLKPANVLCSPAGIAAVSDLGTICANEIIVETSGRSESIANPQKMGLVGTPHYVSPETVYYNITEKGSEIDTAVDIWGIGLILWESFSGKNIEMHHAFDDIRVKPLMTPLKIVFKIGELATKRKFLYNHFYKEPKEITSLAHLVWSCTRIDPKERPPISEVIRRYQLWAEYAMARLQDGTIKSIHECFDDAVV